MASFSKTIIDWYELNKRDLPWRNTKDPYLIWLSEIILQQTRVNQGLPYYQKFVKKYPNVKALSSANEDDILKLWQGLGYYSRARNMHHAAKTIVKEFQGKFPSDINEIKKLKGVGTYTSAAITSFAFNQPHAVVDGNVYRVLSRYLGIKEPIDSTIGKKEFEKNAASLLDKTNSAIYNQAIMEFGAKQCKPVNPECSLCPLKTSCCAFNKNEVELLPIKSKKVKQRKRYFNYLMINSNDSVYISKRIKNDIWKNLFEFPLIETDKKIGKKDLINTNEWKELVTVKDYEIKSPPQLFKHILTHQKIEASFWEININGTLSNVKNNLILVKNSELANYAVPRLIDRFLEIKFVY